MKLQIQKEREELQYLEIRRNRRIMESLIMFFVNYTNT